MASSIDSGHSRDEMPERWRWNNLFYQGTLWVPYLGAGRATNTFWYCAITPLGTRSPSPQNYLLIQNTPGRDAREMEMEQLVLPRDIVGPLPRSWSGNKYILVLCDYATRYPKPFPSKLSIDTEHIAEALINVFAGWGVPREILTDQGSNFTSQLLAELYRLLGVKALRTSPYHPQTDGLVERFNQTLKAMLRKTVTEEGKNWDKLLPYVLFAYREVPQVSTGFSPFELLYGRVVRGPLDVLRESWEANEKSNESVVSHILSIRERMARMMEMARENEARAKDQQKKWYDRNARSRKFKEGDEVLVMLPTSTSKLLAQ